MWCIMCCSACCRVCCSTCCSVCCSTWCRPVEGESEHRVLDNSRIATCVAVYCNICCSVYCSMRCCARCSVSGSARGTVCCSACCSIRCSAPHLLNTKLRFAFRNPLLARLYRGLTSRNHSISRAHLVFARRNPMFTFRHVFHAPLILAIQLTISFLNSQH